MYIHNALRNLLEINVAWGGALSSEEFFTQEECQALRNGQSFLVDDLRTTLICQHLQQKVDVMENDLALPAGYMCMPLISQDKTIGIIYLEAAQGSDPPSTRKLFADAMSEQITLALVNVKLQETLRGQSVRDPLTGLFNRRYMDESIGREISRAVRKGNSLGIIMFDIDHFKALTIPRGMERAMQFYKGWVHFFWSSSGAKTSPAALEAKSLFLSCRMHPWRTRTNGPSFYAKRSNNWMCIIRGSCWRKSRSPSEWRTFQIMEMIPRHCCELWTRRFIAQKMRGVTG